MSLSNASHLGAFVEGAVRLAHGGSHSRTRRSSLQLCAKLEGPVPSGLHRCPLEGLAFTASRSRSGFRRAERLSASESPTNGAAVGERQPYKGKRQGEAAFGKRKPYKGSGCRRATALPVEALPCRSIAQNLSVTTARQPALSGTMNVVSELWPAAPGTGWPELSYPTT